MQTLTALRHPLTVLVVLAVTLLTAARATAEVKVSEVHYNDGEVKLVGFLAYDDAGPATKPGIVVYPEWWGQDAYPRERAGQLARLGYVAFCADMYGDRKVVTTPDEAGALATPFYADPAMARKRAGAALSALQAMPMVDKTKVAAIGYCFGGSMALELARSGAPLAAVVSFHGGLKTGAPAAVGTVKAKLLVLSGADDPMVGFDQVTLFNGEMKAAGAQYQIVLYSGAEHAFTNPAADAHHIPGIAYNAVADAASWQAMQTFLTAAFTP